MRFSVWISAVTLVVGSGLTRADQERPIIRSRVDLVNVTATVTDGSGRRVTTLKRDDFQVLEDSVPQEIAFFSAGEDTPVSLGLVVDTSGSMVDKMEDVEDALAHFIATLRDKDEAFVTTFAASVERVLPFTAGTSDRLRRAVTRLRPNGGTALYDALIDAVEQLGRGTHAKKALILLTDGNDTVSASSRSDAERAVARSEILLYAFGIGHGSRGSLGHGGSGQAGRGGREDRVDLGVLRDLADPTGGRAYLLEEAHRGGRDLIDEAVAEVARELRQQYTLGYYPANTARDGKFRRVDIRVPNAAFEVRARRGYTAGRDDSRGRLDVPPSIGSGR